MSTRPDLAVMWALAFEHERDRLRPGARRYVAATYRCSRRGKHLQAVVMDSTFGRWVAWRPAGFRPAGAVWQEEWLSENPRVEVTCHCGQRRLIDVR